MGCWRQASRGKAAHTFWTRETYSPSPFEKPGVFVGHAGDGIVAAGSLLGAVDFGNGLLTPSGGSGVSDLFVAKYEF